MVAAAPPAGTDVGGEAGVGVLQSAGDLVLTRQHLHLLHQVHHRVVLLVGLPERGLELLVRLDQALDLLHGVHDEHVDQVLTGAVQPVVERLWGGGGGGVRSRSGGGEIRVILNTEKSRTTYGQQRYNRQTEVRPDVRRRDSRYGENIQ